MLRAMAGAAAHGTAANIPHHAPVSQSRAASPAPPGLSPKVTFTDNRDSTTIRVAAAQWRGGSRAQSVADLTPVFDSLGERMRLVHGRMRLVRGRMRLPHGLMAVLVGHVAVIPGRLPPGSSS